MGDFISQVEAERGEDPDLVSRGHLRADRHCEEGTPTRRLALHIATDILGVCFLENRARASLPEDSRLNHDHQRLQVIALVRFLTGH